MPAKAKLPGDLERPVALVKKPRLRKLGRVEVGLRRGRGFSIGELREAGLTPEKARKLGLYVDKRRKTVHSWNVEALKKFLEEARKKGIEI